VLFTHHLRRVEETTGLPCRTSKPNALVSFLAATAVRLRSGRLLRDRHDRARGLGSTERKGQQASRPLGRAIIEAVQGLARMLAKRRGHIDRGIRVVQCSLPHAISAPLRLRGEGFIFRLGLTPFSMPQRRDVARINHRSLGLHRCQTTRFSIRLSEKGHRPVTDQLRGHCPNPPRPFEKLDEARKGIATAPRTEVPEVQDTRAGV
jgi:hypothetical protein